MHLYTLLVYRKLGNSKTYLRFSISKISDFLNFGIPSLLVVALVFAYVEPALYLDFYDFQITLGTKVQKYPLQTLCAGLRVVSMV